MEPQSSSSSEPTPEIRQLQRDVACLFSMVRQLLEFELLRSTGRQDRIDHIDVRKLLDVHSQYMELLEDYG